MIGALKTVPKCLVRELEKLEIGGPAGTIQTIALLRSEKSPGDRRRLAVTRTPVKDDQLTMV